MVKTEEAVVAMKGDISLGMLSTIRVDAESTPLNL
jgi:hypothetical protein